MTTIQSPANNYDFGHDFNYALWTPGTTVSLVNVPWNNDYRDIVDYDHQSELDAYIDRQETIGIVVNNVSYVKPNEPIRLDVPFNVAYTFNYLRATNPVQPINGSVARNYYYFITAVNYVAPNTTEFTVQLDVWQSFSFGTNFGNCYVERGHIGIANENAFNNYGRDYLTIDEGIDTGREYQVVDIKTYTIMDTGRGTGQAGYDILGVSATDLNADPQEIVQLDTNNDGTPDTSVYQPILKTAGGSMVQGVASGASVYVWKSWVEFQVFMQTYTNYPWITQGIMGIYIIPNISKYHPDFEYAPGKSQATQLNYDTNSVISHLMYPNWRDSDTFNNIIPQRYWKLKKFFTYPYMAIEMTTWSATPIVIKPESWNDPNATVRDMISLIPGSQRIVFTPFHYNYNSANANIDPAFPGDDGGDYLDFATMVANFITVPIVNNAAIGYLAANRNSIAYSHTSADWSQQRALRGNEVSYDQASTAINTSQALNAIGNTANLRLTASQNLQSTQQSTLNAASSFIGGGIAGAASKGPAGAAGGMLGGGIGALGGAIGNAINVDANNRNFGINYGASVASNQTGNNQSRYMRDTNKDLADWAARGDYENTIAGINAKVRDAALMPPSTVGQYGGDAFNLVNNAAELSLRWKMLDRAAMTVVGEYWLRYGYAIHKFINITTFKVMTKFSYWKMKETYLVAGNMPETYKQVLRGIFEKGVTVWSNPDEIGLIDIADNEPLDGISY